MEKKQNYFGAKYENEEIITEKLNGEKNMENSYKDLKKDLRQKYIHLVQPSQRYRIGKHKDVKVYMDTGFKKDHYHPRQNGYRNEDSRKK